MVNSKLRQEKFLPDHEANLLKLWGGKSPPDSWCMQVPEGLEWANSWLYRTGKVPYWIDANGKQQFDDWNDARNQYFYEEVKDKGLHLGIVCGSGLVCLDIDDVTDDNGYLKEPFVETLLERLETYASFSSNGHVHIWFWTNDKDLIINKKIRWNRLTKAKKESDIIGDRKFVAFTGIGLPVYGKYPVRKLSLDDAEWLKENLIPVADNDVSNGHKPFPVTTTPATRESGSRTEPFGIKWKSSITSYVQDLYAWKIPRGMKDKSHSGWNRFWLRAYWQHAVSPNPSEAIYLSQAAETHFDKNAPPGFWYKRKRKTVKWHIAESGKAFEFAVRKERIVFLEKREKYNPTPIEKLYKQAIEHLLSTDMSSTNQHFFLYILNQAGGRTSIPITNISLAKTFNTDEKTVRRFRTEIRKHKCIEIKGRIYHFKLDSPCNAN